MQNTRLPLELLANKVIKVDIRIVAIVISLAMSVLSLYLNPIFNPDASYYFYLADIYQNEGYQAVNNHYRRPFYSIAIHEFSTLLHISHVIAANILNAATLAVLVYSFISVVQQYSNRRIVSIFAAITILLLPSLNEYRYHVIRDFGLWAFMLTSLLCLIIFIRQDRLIYACLFWPASTVLAIAFRPEAVVLFFLPLALLLTKPFSIKKRIKKCAQLYMVPVLGLVFIIIGKFQGSETSFDFLLQSLNAELIFYLDRISAPFALVIEVIRENVLEIYSRHLANDIFIVSMLYILGARIIEALSVPVAFLLVYSNSSKYTLIPSDIKSVHLVLLFVFFLIPLVFIFNKYFVSVRYVFPLVLVMLLSLPVLLADIYERECSKNQAKRFHVILLLFCIFFFIDGFISFGAKKVHVTEGLSWMQENIPSEATLITNHRQAGILSGAAIDYMPSMSFRPHQYDAKKMQETISGYDYVVIQGGSKTFEETTKKVDLLMEQVALFQDKKKRYFVIYRNKSLDSISH